MACRARLIRGAEDHKQQRGHMRHRENVRFAPETWQFRKSYAEQKANKSL